eukprot:SAG31_NODE_2957_length_4857_cov_47.100883_2_plen_98_part_00
MNLDHLSPRPPQSFYHQRGQGREDEQQIPMQGAEASELRLLWKPVQRRLWEGELLGMDAVLRAWEALKFNFRQQHSTQTPHGVSDSICLATNTSTCA